MTNTTQAKVNNAQWGPLAHLPRADAVFAACAQLIADDEKPSRERVRELIGGGSARDIAPLIKLYQSQQSLYSDFEHTPDIVLALLAKQLECVFTDLNGAYDDRLLKEKSLFDETTQSLIDEIVQVETLNNELIINRHESDAKMEALIEQLAERNTQNQQLQDDLAKMEQRLNEKIVKNDQLTDQLHEQEKQGRAREDALKETFKTAQAEAECQRQTLMQTHDNETARLMTLLGNERAEWQKKENQLNQAAEAIQQSLKRSQVELEKRSSELTFAHNTLKDKETLLLGLNERLLEQQKITKKFDAVTLKVEDLEQKNKALKQSINESKNIAEALQLMQNQINSLTIKHKSQKPKRKPTDD